MSSFSSILTPFFFIFLSFHFANFTFPGLFFFFFFPNQILWWSRPSKWSLRLVPLCAPHCGWWVTDLVAIVEKDPEGNQVKGSCSSPVANLPLTSHYHIFLVKIYSRTSLFNLWKSYAAPKLEQENFHSGIAFIKNQIKDFTPFICWESLSLGQHGTFHWSQINLFNWSFWRSSHGVAHSYNPITLSTPHVRRNQAWPVYIFSILFFFLFFFLAISHSTARGTSLSRIESCSASAES